MKKREQNMAKRWRIRQAKLLIGSFDMDIAADEKFESGDVVLATDKRHIKMRCVKCGKTWKANSINLRSGLLRVQAFIPREDAYRPFFSCPNGCNKGYWLDKDAGWHSAPKKID